MPEALVAIISFGLILVPLGLFCYGVTRTARHTAESASALFNVLGVLLVLVGFVALLWTQVTFGDRHLPDAARWDVAIGPLIVIGVGLLVCIGALMLRVVQDREPSRGTRV